ncbi:MAG: NEW3 domain-containing protein, partial [Solirubrobacteraceae bacterium]
SSASVTRGGTVKLSIAVANHTTAHVDRGSASVTAPSALGLRGAPSVTIHALSPGQSRKVTLAVKVGRDAKVGTHTVTVKLRIGGKTVTRSVSVRVRR